MGKYRPTGYKTYIQNLFDKTKSAIKFEAQKTRATCGCACLVSIATLFDINITEYDLAATLETKPYPIGTKHEKMIEWAETNLPIKSLGEDTYMGGLAVANTRNQLSGVGHYIVLLGKRDHYIRYYCPRIAQTVITHESDLDWRNGEGTIERWSINFDNDKDFWRTPIAAQLPEEYYDDMLKA